jgi:hypothetical protein
MAMRASRGYRVLRRKLANLTRNNARRKPMSTKEEYLRRVEEQLPKFDSDIALMRAKAGMSNARETDDCSQKIDELCTKYTILRLRLQVLKNRNDENWRRHCKRIDRALGELKGSINTVGTWVWVRLAD